MAFGHLGTLGSGFGSLGLLGGARSGPDLSGFLFYDNFSGSVAALNGRVPNKGNAWGAAGGSAGDMTAGGGRMRQTTDTFPGAAGYAVNNLTGGAKKITAKWTFDGGAADYPATIAVMDSGNLSTAKVLHGEMGLSNFFIRLLDTATGVFLLPAWSLFGANFATPATGQIYTTELYTEGKWSKMILKNATGTVVGQEVIYDPTTAAYTGSWMFAETFTSHMSYSLVTAEANLPGGWVWPTLNIIKETAFPANADGWVNSIFGGTAVWGSGKVTITGAGIGQGGELPMAPLIGALQVGDKIWFSFDASSISNPSGQGIWVTTLPTATVTSVASDIVTLTANGRCQGTLTVSTAGNLSFVVCNPGLGGTDSVAIDNLLLIKNPPTSF